MNPTDLKEQLDDWFEQFNLINLLAIEGNTEPAKTALLQLFTKYAEGIIGEDEPVEEEFWGIKSNVKALPKVVNRNQLRAEQRKRLKLTLGEIDNG